MDPTTENNLGQSVKITTTTYMIGEPVPTVVSQNIPHGERVPTVVSQNIPHGKRVPTTVYRPGFFGRTFSPQPQTEKVVDQSKLERIAKIEKIEKKIERVELFHENRFDSVKPLLEKASGDSINSIVNLLDRYSIERRLDIEKLEIQLEEARRS